MKWIFGVCCLFFLLGCSAEQIGPNTILDPYIFATYDGSFLPGFPWTLEGSGTLTLLNNSLFLKTNSSLIYETTWENNREDGFFVQAKVKIIQSQEKESMGIFISDDTYERYLTLYEDKIAFHDQTRSHSPVHAMDTTDDYHVYGIFIQNDTAEVFVDGEFVFAADFTQVLTKTPYHISFGSHNPDSSGEAYWDYVQFGRSR